MLSQTLFDTSVVEQVAPMMNVLTDIHSGMQSLNLDHLTVMQKGPGGKKGDSTMGGDKKSSAAMVKKCERNPWTEECVKSNFEMLDNDNGLEW